MLHVDTRKTEFDNLAPLGHRSQHASVMLPMHGLRFNSAKLSRSDAYEYLVERLDSLQDLAVLCERAGEHEEERRYLDQVASSIDSNHKIVKGNGLSRLDNKARIDAFYKLMGQVELLNGAIEYESTRTQPGTEIGATDLPSDEALINTSRHCL